MKTDPASPISAPGELLAVETGSDPSNQVIRGARAAISPKTNALISGINPNKMRILDPQ